MKKAYFILLSLLLAACSSDGEKVMQPNDPFEIEAKVKYVAADKTLHFDVGATLYVFRNFDDNINYKYKDGKYIHKENGTEIAHTLKGIADDLGLAAVTAKYGQKYLVVIESAALTGQYKEYVYNINDNQFKIGIGVTFGTAQ